MADNLSVAGRQVKKDPRPTAVYSPQRVRAIFAVAFLLGIALVLQAVRPVAERVSQRYVLRGDAYLEAEDFSQAEDQYRTALEYDGGNADAQARLDLAKRAAVDIASAADFYRQHQVASVLAKLQVAQKAYARPPEALAAGVELYQKGEYAYARYPLERAVALDPGYSEAWHYVALTYGELAKVDASYGEKATAALAEQNRLTTKYLK